MSAPTKPEAHIFAPIAALLLSKTSIESFFGAEHLDATHACPCYVWVPTVGAASYELAPVNEEHAHGDEATESLGNIDYTFEVHCWHRSHDEAWGMLQNLVKAARDELSDAQFTIGGLDALPNELGLEGWVLTVPITVTVPLWDPDTGEWVRVKFTDVVLDDSQGNETDGVLTAPKK